VFDVQKAADIDFNNAPVKIQTLRRAAHRGIKINDKAYFSTIKACSQASSWFPCTSRH
jgi:hypothetical protein